MDVASAVCVAEVDQGRVDYNLLLALVQEVGEVAEVAVTTPYSVPGTKLVKNVNLSRSKPALKI